MKTPAGLALAPQHQRGHHAPHGTPNRGRPNTDPPRTEPAGLPLPRAADGRPVLAVDVSPWPRPDAGTCPDHSSRHTYRHGDAKHQAIPDRPYPFVVALETGRTSWTTAPDTVRPNPDPDAAATTAAPLRDMAAPSITAGQRTTGDPEAPAVMDTDYDTPRIAHPPGNHPPGDQPTQAPGRLRPNRVTHRPAPTRAKWHAAHPAGGRPPKHGGESAFGDPATRGDKQEATTTETRHHATTTVRTRDRHHPRPTRRAARPDHDSELPLLQSTVIQPAIEKLPSGEVNRPTRPYRSPTDTDPADIDHCRHPPPPTVVPAQVRPGTHLPPARTDTGPNPTPPARLRGNRPPDPDHDRHPHPAPPRPAHPLITDLHHPQENPAEPNKPTPTHTRRGSRSVRAAAARPCRTTPPVREPRTGGARPLPAALEAHPIFHTSTNE
ncbi:hypothetical protein KSE_01080 [Kitasatospora setae KM-6054]|uniref:Transposase IS701-like DDE domain-containing protein n=1 Tax=Kitasatospora setae (strain ATCC 33774 / DSM 43861 / JCM 3304 / KCC A-0304 / NBRC 14216 / KM-6054) TaxID=452652 RepID=E4N428_KITSK|nr:hypothetical protein KSE_01080 [Kitasatospora setae KM-6054]